MTDDYTDERPGSFHLEIREDLLNRERIARECDQHPGTMDGPAPELTPKGRERLEQLDAALERLGVPRASV